MRLRRLDLTRYGKFTDFSLDFGAKVAESPDLHIVYGLNEAGKSTSLSAYLDLLFGIEERTRYGFLHQGKAMEIGACLEFDGRSHEVRRVKQRSNSLLDARGQPLNEAILSVPLAGLTRDAYRMMFSLDDHTLEEGGNAILESRGDLGEMLFSASAGLAGVSSILETAAREADGIFRKRASSTRIASLKRQIADLKVQRDEIDVQASAYRTLRAALEQAEAAYDAAMEEIGKGKSRSDEITRVLRAYPLAAEHRRGADELRDYANLPHPPRDWTSVLPDLVVEETRLNTEIAGIGLREQKVRDELNGLVVDGRLIEMSDRLDGLVDAVARYATAQEDLPKRTQALVESNRMIDLILATLGQSGAADARTLLIPAATIGRLRELIGEKSGIEVALSSAEKEYDAERHAIEKEVRDRQMLERASTRIDPGKIAQLQTALRRLRDGDLVAGLRFAERALPARRQAFNDAALDLVPWIGDGDALRLLSLPSSDRIESWKSVESEMEKRRLGLIERERDLSTTIHEDEVRLDLLRETIGDVDDDAAMSVLGQRDDAWARHMSALDRESAKSFEILMRAADAAAAARLNGARELEELRTLKANLAVNRMSIERQSQLLRELDENLQALRREIRMETPATFELDDTASLGSWLARIARWAEARTLSLAAWDDLRRALSEAEDARTLLATEHDRLAATLVDNGITVDSLDTAALIQCADTVLANHEVMQTRRQDADRRLADLEAATTQRKAELERAIDASSRWQRNWLGAVSATWFGGEESAGAVRELLDAVASLPGALRERDDLVHRIGAMENDQAALADTVARIHDALGKAFDRSDPVEAAKILLGRREEARRIEAKQGERQTILGDLSTERERLEGELAVHAARKKELTEFFNVEALADVRDALERCRKRDELVEKQRKLARQITDDMQLPSFEAAMASLADVDLIDLQREQAELVSRLEDLDGRAKNLFADRARATDRLTMIGGDDTVARLEANRRTLLLELEDLALHYLRLKSGGLIAEHGIRAYRDKHRSAMMNRASAAFRLITREEYTGLATRPDRDREALIGLSRHGGSKLAVEMSKGTQFQLYLALRLAGYEEFATARPSVPFIADDIMETFDEPRSEEVFRLFAQMARVGQVVYLTHHRHLCEMASQIVPNVKIHHIT